MGHLKFLFFSALLLNAYLFDSLYIWHKNNTRWQCIPRHFWVKRWKVRVAQVVQSQGHTGFYGVHFVAPCLFDIFIIPPEQQSCWGVYWFNSVCPSVSPSRLPCGLFNIFSSGWILSILATNDHCRERVCHTMTFDLDLYLQGHLALTQKIVSAL